MNVLEIALQTIKEKTDEAYGFDTEKIKMSFDYEKQTVQQFYKFGNSPNAQSPGIVEMKDDRDSVQLGNMFIAGLKNKIPGYGRTLKANIIFDVKKCCIESVELVYLDITNEVKTYKHNG